MRRIRHTRKSERPQKFIKTDPRTTIQGENDTPDDAARSNNLTNTLSNKPKSNNLH
jgi:hypothetical protein